MYRALLEPERSLRCMGFLKTASPRHVLRSAIHQTKWKNVNCRGNYRDPLGSRYVWVFEPVLSMVFKFVEGAARAASSSASHFFARIEVPFTTRNLRPLAVTVAEI